MAQVTRTGAERACDLRTGATVGVGHGNRTLCVYGVIRRARIRREVRAAKPAQFVWQDKPAVRGVVAVMQLGLPIEKIGVDDKSFGEIMEIAFTGYYKLRIRSEGWLDMGYERDADDLSLDWFAGREPQLIAMG